MTLPTYSSFAPAKAPLAESPPTLGRADYEARLDAIRAATRATAYDTLVVYGDREHFANLRFACGHDPRFEEAVLVVTPDDAASIVVRNEGFEYIRASPAELSPVLCQSLSLMGQDRTRQPSLVAALREAGVVTGAHIGVVGWKYFSNIEAPEGEYLAVPAFLISALAEIIGPDGTVRDATRLFIDPIEGLRACVDAPTIAEFEYGAALAAEHVRRVVDSFELGMSELDAACLMELNGYPHTCHPMVIAGRRDFVGLRSPSARRIERGDVLSIAVGLWGGLTARAGIVAASEDELDSDQRGFGEFAGRYFGALQAWYHAIGIGVRARDVVAAVNRSLTGAPFTLLLNPGHLTHYDEWLHTPMVATEERMLRSGMVLQCDLIPASDPQRAFCNCEDTICLANAELREQLERAYPELMKRVEERRQRLAIVMGEEPAEEILPLTNMVAYFRPLLLRCGEALSFPA